MDFLNIWANLSDSLIFFSCSNGIQLRQCTAEGALNIESRARSEIKEEKTFLWKLIWRRGERGRNITEKEVKTFSWKLIWNRHRVKKWIETFLWKLVKNRIKRVCFVTPGKNPENSRKVFNSLKGSSFPLFFGSVLLFVFFFLSLGSVLWREEFWYWFRLTLVWFDWFWGLN